MIIILLSETLGGAAACMLARTRLKRPVRDPRTSRSKGSVVSAWGWLAHHTGGKWRRGLYRTAPTIDGLLDSGDAWDIVH